MPKTKSNPIDLGTRAADFLRSAGNEPVWFSRAA